MRKVKRRHLFSLISILALMIGVLQIPGARAYPSSYTFMVGKVPYFLQTPNACGATAVKEVLWWFGRTYVEMEDINSLLDKTEGPYWADELEGALIYWLGNGNPDNCDSTYGGSSDYEEAKEKAKSWIWFDTPVICCIKLSTIEYHYVTLVGYDDAEGCWYLHDTARHFTDANGYGYDVKVSYDEFKDYWDCRWTTDLLETTRYGFIAVNPKRGTGGLAQPKINIFTLGSSSLDNLYDNQLPAKLTVLLTNVGSDLSAFQPSEMPGDHPADGVTIQIFGAQIDWLDTRDFQSYQCLDTGESGGPFAGPIQPTTKLQLNVETSLASGTTFSAEIHLQPSFGHVSLHYWGRLTDRDDWWHTWSVWLDDDSYRAPRGYGVRTLLPERYCWEVFDRAEFWIGDDDIRPPQFSHPKITPFPVYDNWTDSIAFTMDIVDADSSVGQYWFTYRWWDGDWTILEPTAIATLPGGLTARATIPRSEWINHVGKGLQYAWYAADTDNDRPDDSKGDYSNVYPGPVIIDDDTNLPSLYNPTSSGTVPESYMGDYMLQISASDYSGIGLISCSYQFNDGPWSPDVPSAWSNTYPDASFNYGFIIPRSEWINHVNEEIHWKVHAEDADNDRPGDSLGMYSDVYDAGKISNIAPLIDPVGDKTIDEKTLLTFAVTASNHNIPGKPLTFSLGEGAPTGASIDSATGIFTWTPTEIQGPGIYSITFIMSDGMTEDSQTITVAVNEVSETRDVQNITNIIANKAQLPTNAFAGATSGVKENRRNSMLNQLNAIFNDMRNAEALTDPKKKNAEYYSAIDHLNALLDEIDGFAERGAADQLGSGYTPDWIITAQGQALIDPLIRELLATLATRLIP